MPDRQFRVVLTGDNAGIVGAANGATTALKNTGKAADDLSGKTDKVTHASSGMTREIIVLAHELSQGSYSKFGGSLLVLAEYSKTATAALGLLVGPIGVVLAAVATLGIVANLGAHQSDALNKSLLLTGQNAGFTAGQVEAMAKSIGQSTATSTSSARATLQDLISDGRLTGDALTSTATAIQQLSKATGESTEDIAKRFSGLIDNVGSGAEKLNEQYHFLSASELEHIKTLDRQGDGMKAVAEVMTMLSARAGVLTGSMGILAKAANLVNSVLDIFRTTSTESAMDRIRAQIQQNESGPLASLRQASTDKLKEQLGYLQEQERMERRSIDAATERNQKDAAGIAFGKLKEETLTRQQKLERELAKANALADKGGVSDADRQGVLDSIREKYKEPKGAKPRNTERQEARANLQQQLDDIRAYVANEADVYRSREDALRLYRSADLIGDQQYLDGLQVASAEYLASLRKAQAEEAADIAIRKAKTSDKGEQARLDEEAARSRAQYANAVRDAQRQVDDAYTQSDLRAVQYARDTTRSNQQLAASLITDTSARTRAIAGLDIAEQQRRVSLFVEGTDARRQAESSLADYIVLRNKQLTQDLKPEWQKMLEGFQDTVAYMRQASDDFTTGFINQGRDAFTQFVTTGKLSVSNMVGFIEQQFAKMYYDQYLSKYAADLGSSLFSGIASLFTSSLSIDTSGYSANGGIGYSNAAGISGGRAAGGPVGAGRTYLVGERGPELLRMGAQGGTVVPNDAMSGMNVTIAPTFNGGVTRNELVNGMQVSAQIAVRQIAEARRRGNTNFVGSRG